MPPTGAGFGYTWFTEHYRTWAGRLDVVLRGDHRAGEKLFLDFAGQTIPITDPLTGEITAAQLFVAVLGASNYTYAEALPSQAELWWSSVRGQRHPRPRCHRPTPGPRCSCRAPGR
jgi:transposase